MNPHPDKQRIVVGHFGKSYGIKGWIKVHSTTSPPAHILQYSSWQILHKGQWRQIKIIDSREQSNQIIVKINGCDDPESAKTYTRDVIAIDPEQLLPLPKGEYYWNDLIGLHVYNLEGVDFGVIDSLMETGSNDVLLIKGDRQRLLPYTDEVVKSIDLEQRKMIVDWDPDF